MAAVIDYARGVMPETMAVLEEKHPDSVAARVMAVKSRLLINPAINEDELTEFVKSYLGDNVAYELIPSGIDYWMVQTKINKNLGRPSGVALGGETAQNYDRVKGLLDLAKHLLARIVKYAPIFEDDDSVGKPGLEGVLAIRIPGALRTPDPTAFPKISGGRAIAANGYGVAFPVGWDV